MPHSNARKLKKESWKCYYDAYTAATVGEMYRMDFEVFGYCLEMTNCERTSIVIVDAEAAETKSAEETQSETLGTLG